MFKMRWRFISFCLVVVGFLSFNSPLSAAGLATSIVSRINVGLEEMPLTIGEWRNWYTEDQAYLRTVNILQMNTEIPRIKQAIKFLEEHPDYRDAKGFSVYSPQTTGRLHLLAATLIARENAGGSGAYGEILDHPLKEETPTQYPDLARVVRTLRGLSLPKQAFEDFHIYLLPFSMGPANGYGGDGYAFLAATPAGEKLIPNQLEVTLVHEFGHVLQFRYMNRDTKEGLRLWDDYLTIRGIPWRTGGEAGTKAWTTSSEEVFAEDFRVWEGKSVVGSGYFGDLAYPNPSAVQGEKLRNFFERLPLHQASATEDPWLDGQDNLMNPLRSMAFGATPWIIIGLLALTGLVVLKMRPKRPHAGNIM